PMGGQHSIPALAMTLVVGKPPEKRLALRYLCDRRYVGASLVAALDAITQSFADPSEPVLIDGITAYASLCSEAQYFEVLARFLDHESPNIAAAALTGLHFATPR